MNSEVKQCQNCKQDFTIESEDFNFYEKIKVPPPTFCPECRFQRRLLFRNNRVFYRHNCALCKKSLLSVYNKDRPYTIYCRECWLSDKWNPVDYGREYDFSRTFFEQLQELVVEVPIYNFNVIRMVNSPYAFNATGLKNSYLVVNSSYSEDCMYGNAIDYSKDCVDNSHINHSERCYECFESDRIFDSKYSQLCFDSMELSFCYDMKNCQNCFMCVGLRGKNYCIRNKQYSREEYLEEVKKENLNKRSGISKCKKEFEAAVLKFPNREFSPPQEQMIDQFPNKSFCMFIL